MRPYRFRSTGVAEVLSVLPFIAACATAGAGTRDPSSVSVITGSGETIEIRQGPDIRLNQRVTVTRDEAWAALPRVYEALGMTPDVRDPAGRQIGVSAHRFSGRILSRYPSDFFDCGLDPGLNRPLADQAPVIARVVTDVVAVGAGAELRTLIEATARRTGGNAGTAACRSTGVMEELIARMVEREVNPRR